jgi:hypothetical protein
MKTQHGQGVCALGILAAFTALVAVSCLGPTGIEVRGINHIDIYKNDIWVGQWESPEAFAAQNGPPQEGWMYRNTADSNVYRYNGADWVYVADGPSVPSTIRIIGDYVPPAGGYFPLRVYFTDGGVADGYVDDMNGVVMLYDDAWNDQGGAGKTYHTLRIISGNENILLSRAFDGADPVLLNVDSDGKLQFRAAQVNNPRDPGVPYIPIDTVGELALIGRDDTTRAGAYEQKRDLDLLGVPPEGSGILAPRPHNWKPLGRWDASLGSSQTEKFTGKFDGGFQEINNLFIDGTDPAVSGTGIGLFGYIEGAVLRNIALKSGSVQGYSGVGGIAGRANNSEISGCSNAARVTDYTVAGTVVGHYTDTDCAAGGIVGNAFQATTITACYNTGPVTGAGYVGGVVGKFAGLLAGELYWHGQRVTITACYNTGPVTGTGVSGGIAGSLPFVGTDGGMTHCVNTGVVTGGYGSGGIVGMTPHGNSISACYWREDTASSGIFHEDDLDPDGGYFDETIPFSGNDFPNTGWGTSSDGTSGAWKPGTTGGGQPPRLWYEP